MTGKLAAVLISVRILSCAAWAAPQSGERREDRQVWSEIQVVLPAQGHSEIVVHGSLRLGHNVSKPVYERVGAGIVFHPSRWFALAPTYAHITTQPDGSPSQQENRIYLDGTLSVPAGRWSFSNRNRLECRIIRSQASVRYRSRLQIERPLHARTPKLRLFVSDEIQFDSRVDAWTRNRFATGFISPVSSRASVEVYYLRQNDGFARPGDIHVIGISLKMDLR